MKTEISRNTKRAGRIAADILYDIAGSILYAAGIWTFAKNADFAPGGISGLSLILNHLWGFPLGLTTLLLNVPLAVISYRVIGRGFLLKTAVSMLISTLFLDIIFPAFPIYRGTGFWRLCIPARVSGQEWLCFICTVLHPGGLTL